jgi:hypothetical protein
MKKAMKEKRNKGNVNKKKAISEVSFYFFKIGQQEDEEEEEDEEVGIIRQSRPSRGTVMRYDIYCSIEYTPRGECGGLRRLIGGC